ncbi:MAG: hypothetical protein HY887_04710 [Deltaproteobacteria bacterium]|nr:hypothetical protein [Deltaproteobacteria bacterium]
MAITLTSKFLAEIKKNVNMPCVILEVALDSGTLFLGSRGDITLNEYYLADGTYKADGTITAMGSINSPSPVIKNISSLQNKIDSKSGYSTRGELSFTITGRDNFKLLISGYTAPLTRHTAAQGQDVPFDVSPYLKNRRVTRKDGFIAPGFAYSDYAATFTGRISDWSRKGDELTITASDDLINASKKLPVENSTKTQYLDFRNMNPADIMTNILLTQLGIGAAYVDSTKFASERDTWIPGWVFDRVLTEPKEANEYLNELQQECNSYIIHDGEKITYKVFAPPVPGNTPEEWTDAAHILHGTLSLKSGYKDGFYNRVVVYYDYDESNSDKEENFESAVISVDAGSQDATQWNEVKSKVVKSKWIRTRTYAQPVNVTGVHLYHVSRNNGAGAGTLTFTYNAAGPTLQWTASGDTIGVAEKITKDGKFQIFSADKTKYIRVIVTTASLPASNKTDSIGITALSGDTFAATLAQKLLSRYRDPAATVSFEVDINNVAYNSAFIKPTDVKDVTTDEACEKGVVAWNKERVMLTSVRPDIAKGRVQVEAVDMRLYRRYGFISPAGYPDYPSATDAQREYAFIGDGLNKVNAGQEDGYFIW